jgi:hypothetical protein
MKDRRIVISLKSVILYLSLVILSEAKDLSFVRSA